MASFIIQPPPCIPAQPVGRVSQRRCIQWQCCIPSPCVIFITPRGFCSDEGRAKYLTGCALAGGASLVQIRDIDAREGERRRMADVLVREYGNPRLFVMNGPLGFSVMREIPGFGVHLRERDWGVGVGGIGDTDAVVGCSVHSVRAAVAAMKLRGLSYLQVGSMFETASHPGKVPEGLGLMRDIRRRVGEDMPLIGVGGIWSGNVGQVIRSGASGVAVISAIAEAVDVTEGTRAIVEMMREAWDRDIGKN